MKGVGEKERLEEDRRERLDIKVKEDKKGERVERRHEAKGSFNYIIFLYCLICMLT